MDEIQDIEQLKRRYETLRDKKTEADTLLRTAEAELEKLKAEARERYGTDDVVSLKQKLEDMEAENRRKRQEYQALLDGIERDLKDVEDQLQT